MAPPPPPLPVPKNDPQHVQEMMKKYRIRFLGPVDTISDGSWPANLSTTFEQVKKLGLTDHDTYVEDVRADAGQQPWRYQRLLRARRLFKTAGRCLRARKTEAGWRHDIEPLVCGRFAVEVACKNCRGRLWRSEEEVAPDSNDQAVASDGDSLPSLQARQERRKPCECPAYSFRSELEDSGINPIFDSRAEEAIVYTQEMKGDLRRREHRPDRIIGLCRTRTIESLIGKPDRRHASPSMTVGQAIRMTPFREEGEPVVFPFLIMEAKSEKSGSSFTDIDMQTAFAIRELVLLQEELERAASGLGNADWEAAPLVWYFSYRGEQWRLHGAFPSPNGYAGAVDVVRLWSSDVDSARGALQLLLLVDYVCDWGRDKFRESAIRSLAALSQSNRQGTVASEIFSLGAATATPAPALRSSTIYEVAAMSHRWSRTDRKRDPGPGRALDSRQVRKVVSLTFQAGPVRDIRYITSGSMGILITEQNLEIFQKSFSTEIFSGFAADIVQLTGRWGFETTLRALDEAQAIWHNYKNNPIYIGQGNMKLVATLSCESYLTETWKLVRQLYWLAIEKSALPLLEAAAVRASPHDEGQPTARLSDTSLPVRDAGETLGKYTKACARTNLAACLMHAYVVLAPNPVNTDLQVERPDPSMMEPARRSYEHFPKVGAYGLHPGPVVAQLHMDHREGRLRSCQSLIHRQPRCRHVVTLVNSMGDWKIDELEVLWRCQPGRFERPLLDIGHPILVVDPQAMDTQTGLPADCRFGVEIGLPRANLSHYVTTPKAYFVAERVLSGTRKSWIGPRDSADTIEQLVTHPRAWLVQFAHWPARNRVVEEEEQAEDARNEINTHAAPVERFGAVADWAQGVSHDVIVVEDSDDEIVEHNDDQPDIKQSSEKFAVALDPNSSSSGVDEEGSNCVIGRPEDSSADPANVGTTREPRQGLSVPGLNGQELEGQNGAGERTSGLKKRARKHMGTLAAKRVLPRRSKRISTGKRM